MKKRTIRTALGRSLRSLKSNNYKEAIAFLEEAINLSKEENFGDGTNYSRAINEHINNIILVCTKTVCQATGKDLSFTKDQIENYMDTGEGIHVVFTNDKAETLAIRKILKLLRKFLQSL